MKTVDDFNFKNKKVLIRVDFNVPLNQDLRVSDSTRIEAAKPTIRKVLEDGGSCILMSHLGRPTDREPKFSLRNVIEKASEILGIKLRFAADCIGPEAEAEVQRLEPGQVLLLENLRYHPQEKAGDPEFAKKLAELADFYINDAFGTAHRAHASTSVIAQYFPGQKCSGLLLAAEVEGVEKVMSSGERPVTAIIGGAKVSSKIAVIENILDKIDHLIIGGGMAFTFVKAQGGEIGSSLVEDDKLEMALEILKAASEKGVIVHLPTDTIAADAFKNDAQTKVYPIDRIPKGWMGLDTGPETNKDFAGVVGRSRTILWNGPVGVFEMESFAQGTKSLGDAIVQATAQGAFSLVGGGDSVAAVKQFDLTYGVSYVSTGGGAMLEMLEGKTLPGISALGK